MKTYRKIMKGFSKVLFPEECPEQCRSMIIALCQKNPEERLTMGSLGIQNFKDHPWYRLFSWHQLEMLAMSAPYVPNSSEESAVQKAASSTLREEHSGIAYLDDGTGWDAMF